MSRTGKEKIQKQPVSENEGASRTGKEKIQKQPVSENEVFKEVWLNFSKFSVADSS